MSLNRFGVRLALAQFGRGGYTPRANHRWRAGGYDFPIVKVLINVKNEYSKKEAGKGRGEAGLSVVFKD